MSSNPKASKSKGKKSAKKVPVKVDEQDVTIISEGGDVNKDRRKANAEDSFAELENLTGLSLKNAPAALRIRPKFQSGNEGKRITLRSNFFRLKLTGNTVHQYDIQFDRPDSASVAEKEIEIGRKFRRVTKKIHQQLLAQFVETTGKSLFNGICYAFDSDRILLTNKPLEADNLEVGVYYTFPFKENPKDVATNYQIRIKRTSSVTLSFNFNGENYVHDRAVLQMLDIITKSYAFKNNIVYGSKIFFPSTVRPRILMSIKSFQAKSEKPTPFELAFGYHQSTQFCQSGPMQNIDRASAVLYREGPLLDRIFELFGRPFGPNETLDSKSMDQLKEFIGLRVETEYRNFVSRHSIRSFTRTNSRETSFSEEGGRQTVYNYFVRKYKIHLKYPNLPCVEYGQGKYIPIELCKLLPDQRNQRKLRDDLIKILSTHATSQRPSGRAAGTAESAKSIASNAALAEFGITLNPNMVEVPGRILPAPRLRYSNQPSFVPLVPGDWNMQQPDRKKFYSSKNLSKWVFLCMSRKITDDIIREFCKNLQRVGSMVGVEVSMPSPPVRTTKPALRQTMEMLKKDLQLIVCMIPEEDEIYTEIKSVGDRTLGIPTQIILDKHFNPRNDMKRQKLFDTAYLSNLLLKINSKIGGINLSLADVSKPSILKGLTMVVGVDVNHPSPGENSPSIAAVVGSLNPELSNYHTNIVINRSREETVDVRGMIKPILEAFKKHRGSYPDNIVVYRDGVSEGQFAYVLAYEVFPLRDMLSTDYRQNIKLTYMIVQKRHNARFFPMKKEDSTRSENILPGCVIDTTVCHYKWFDFYLCSQNSFLGTARPGKYTVLWDENNLTADELQKVTYYLCYLFARSTKSIADPAPARYAHHAAARGKVHLKDMMRSKAPIPSNVDLSEAIRVLAPLQNVLYFI
ncbi:protein argonaute-4 [Tetranychus urticae]|uniref:Uncharacterized protein n=1 Tax=Tetranychus urticae TaxID=32264 RepID=T1K1F3_TETUR|nr:protein argonaute-4 [Tetranychus urticae]